MTTQGDVLGAHWQQLVSVGLLGTDRRPVPPPPPGALSELAAESPPTDPAEALVQQVAAVTAIRRAGVRPYPVSAALAPPADDPRPVTPPAAGEVLRVVLAEWPVLEDEWLARAASAGWRLAPELVPLLLARHRSDPTRRGVVESLAGPLGAWLVDHLPELGPARAARERSPAPTELPLPPELVGVPSAAPSEVVRVLAGGLRQGRFGAAHRPVLVLAVARARPDALVPLAVALDAIGRDASSVLAPSLADLARTRAALVAALAPPSPTPSEP